MQIQGKFAIVTGASSGLGAAFSRKLVQSGAKVYGLARSADKLYALQQALGDAFIPVPLDITDEHTLSHWVDTTFVNGHRPHVLINNAGVGMFGPVEDISIENFEHMMRVNVHGVFYLTRKVVPLLKQNPDYSHIVNIASVAGLMGNPNLSAYNATKFAVRGFTDAWFKELRHNRIKVTGMYPGSIATPFFDKIDEVTLHNNMLQADDIADTLIHILQTPDSMLIDEIVIRPLNPKAS